MTEERKTTHFIQNGWDNDSYLVFDDKSIENDFFKNLTPSFLHKYVHLWSHDDLKRLILTHTDSDGHGSGALLYKAWRTPNYENVTLYNIDYEFDMEQIKDKLAATDIVFISDLSLNQEQISYIEDNAGGIVVWIDHHISSLRIEIKDRTKFYSFIHAEIGVSAACLVWIFLRFMTAIQRWLYGGELDDTKITRETVTPQQIVRCNVLDNYEITSPKNAGEVRAIRVPNIIKMISLYDTFDDGMDTRFIYGYSSYNTNINSDEGKRFWNILLGDISGAGYERTEIEHNLLEELINKGEVIKQYIDSDYARMRKGQLYQFEVDIVSDGKHHVRTIAAMNANGFSMLFGGVIEEVDAVIRYYQQSDGKWNYGIYSSKTRPTALNCEPIATHYGGGGHRHAAGWVSPVNEPWTLYKTYMAQKRPVIIKL